jgi:hypothetical protein
MENTSDSNKNFFKHVFNFDDDSKSDILNIIQYALIAIIPVVILNKGIKKYIPEADDKKGSLEITAEIIIQVIVIFMGLLIIHRIITFIPTYSGVKYPEFNILYIILALLLIIISLQTKLGEKISILSDRLMELWNGKSDDKDKKKKSNSVKVSQPISGQQMMPPTQPTYTDGTAISSLPTNESQYNESAQQVPNFDAMYRQDTTPLVGAATPGMTQESFGPVAASEFLGGSFGTSW